MNLEKITDLLTFILIVITLVNIFICLDLDQDILRRLNLEYYLTFYNSIVFVNIYYTFFVIVLYLTYAIEGTLGAKLTNILSLLSLVYFVYIDYYFAILWQHYPDYTNPIYLTFWNSLIPFSNVSNLKWYQFIDIFTRIYSCVWILVYLVIIIGIVIIMRLLCLVYIFNHSNISNSRRPLVVSL